MINLVRHYSRLLAFFQIFSDASKSAAPNTYEVYHDILDRLRAVPKSIQQNTSIVSDEKYRRQGGNAGGTSTAGESGQSGASDNELERIRGVIAERLGSSSDSGRIDRDGARLEARAIKPRTYQTPSDLMLQHAISNTVESTSGEQFSRLQTHGRRLPTTQTLIWATSFILTTDRKFNRMRSSITWV